MAETVARAISGIAEPEKIRVVLFINNELVHVPLLELLHVPLLELLKELQQEVDALDARVTDLETP